MPPTRKRNTHGYSRAQRNHRPSQAGQGPQQAAVAHHGHRRQQSQASRAGHQQQSQQVQQSDQEQQSQQPPQQQPQQPQQPQIQDKQLNGGDNTNNDNIVQEPSQLPKQSLHQVPATAAPARADCAQAPGAPSKAEIMSAVHKDIQGLLEEDLFCAICREIYIDPLVLNCAHSFCRFCLNNWLSKQVGCPSCRMVVVFQTENLALKNIVNRMMQTSSQVFQDERKQTLDQRSRAELAQDQEKVKPLMERRSFFSNGKSRPIWDRDHHRIIRPWRGPNGATIWRTRLDASGQVVRPQQGDSQRMEPDMENIDIIDINTSDDEEDDDDDDDGHHYEDGDSDDSYYEGARFSPTESEIEAANSGEDSDDSDDGEIDDDPEFDESASEMGVDDSSDDESYASSRRRQLNDLHILAGYVAADDDDDYEIDIDQVQGADSDEYDSDNDDDDAEVVEGPGEGDDDDDDDDDAESSSSGEPMELEDTDDESIHHRIGLFATRREIRRGELSSSDEDSDSDDDGAAAAQEVDTSEVEVESSDDDDDDDATGASHSSTEEIDSSDDEQHWWVG